MRSGIFGRCRPAQRTSVDWLLSLGTSRWGKKRDAPARYSIRERRSFALTSTEDRGARSVRDAFDAYSRMRRRLTVIDGQPGGRPMAGRLPFA
jgi:hypothetical protein